MLINLLIIVATLAPTVEYLNAAYVPNVDYDIRKISTGELFKAYNRANGTFKRGDINCRKFTMILSDMLGIKDVSNSRKGSIDLITEVKNYNNSLRSDTYYFKSSIDIFVTNCLDHLGANQAKNVAFDKPISPDQIGEVETNVFSDLTEDQVDDALKAIEPIKSNIGRCIEFTDILSMEAAQDPLSQITDKRSAISQRLTLLLGHTLTLNSKSKFIYSNFIENCIKSLSVSYEPENNNQQLNLSVLDPAFLSELSYQLRKGTDKVQSCKVLAQKSLEKMRVPRYKALNQANLQLSLIQEMKKHYGESSQPIFKSFVKNVIPCEDALMQDVNRTMNQVIESEYKKLNA